VNVVEGVYNANPVFQMQIDTNESAEIPFSDFEGGDAMLSLPLAANTVQVNVLNDNGKPAYSWAIDLGEFGDKRRQIKHSAGRYDGQDVVVEYEGQIIYNQQDYHRGLLHVNNLKIEESKQNKYDFTHMRDDLLDLFRDQNLKASLLRDVPSRRPSLPLTSSQYDLNGPTPVLRNSQIAGNFVNKEFRAQDGPSMGSRVYGAAPVMATQPREFGQYAAPAPGLRGQAEHLVRGIVPQNTLSWSRWVHLLFAVCLGLLLVSLLVNWHRATFASLLMALVFVTWYFVKEDFDSLLPPLGLTAGFVIALVIDLSWIIAVSAKLWRNNMHVHSGSLAGMDKFMIIMSYILIGLEAAAVVISVLLWRTGMFTNQRDSALKSEVPFRF